MYYKYEILKNYYSLNNMTTDFHKHKIGHLQTVDSKNICCALSMCQDAEIKYIHCGYSSKIEV